MDKKEKIKLIETKANLTLTDILSIVSNLNEEDAIEIAYKIIERFEKQGKTVNSIYASMFIQIVPEEKRKEILLKILDLEKNRSKVLTEEEILSRAFHKKKKTATSMLFGAMESILENIKENERIEVLREIKEKNLSFKPKELLSHIPMKDFKEALELFKDEYETPLNNPAYDIEHFVRINSNLEAYIDAYIEVGDGSLLNERSFSTLLESAESETRTRLLQKYVFEKEIFNYEKVINHIFSPDIRYQIVDQTLPYLNKSFAEESVFEFIDKYVIKQGEEIFYPALGLTYPNIGKVYVKKYQINPNNFDKYIQTVGYIGTKFLDSQNIREALKMPEEDFEKYIKIFDKENTKLNMQDVNTVCNALFQREFRIQEGDYNIFSTIEHTIKDKEDIIPLLNYINFFINIEEKAGIDIDEFITKLYSLDKDALDTMHQITNEFLAKKRDIYFKERQKQVLGELKLEKKITKASYKKKYIQKVLKNELPYDISSAISGDRERLTEKQRKLYENRELLIKLFAFKKNPSEVKLTPDEKRYLKTFETLLDLLYEKRIRFEKFEEDDDVLYEYAPCEVKEIDLLGIMSNISPEAFRKNILSNEEVYQNLLNTIKKYHLLGFKETFSKVFPKSDITFNEGTVAGIICYFNEIYPKLDNASFLTKMIDYGNIYDTTSILYKLLLGKEDYALISANEGKNKASAPKYKRLEEVPRLVRKMYERKYITVPPFDENITLENGKEINVTLGDTKSMMNLTYGERTNSCLRICGAFNDLFEYCLENENGFHIRFTNPKTGKFVSRVSGIRNGNTIFLNELRESVDEDYTNEDLFLAIKKTAKKIIQNSENSNLPIQNIIISSDYALKDHLEEEVTLRITDRNEAFRSLSFNVKQSLGLVLSENLSPYIFTECVPEYHVLNTKPQTLLNEEATNKAKQMLIIKGLLEGKELDEIEINIPPLNYCTSTNEDFTAEDKEGNTIRFSLKENPNEMEDEYENQRNSHRI